MLNRTPIKRNCRSILAAASLASGLALVLTIFLRTSLALTLPSLGIVAGVTISSSWSHMPVKHRSFIKALAFSGLIGGIWGTIAYDVSRCLLVHFAHWDFDPFKTFPLFGYLLLGEGSTRVAAIAAGTAYHFLNGITFSIAYNFLLGGRDWKLGVLWALGLEAAMFSIYPGWLNLKAVMKEFTVVSVSGHVIYGSVIGLSSQKMLRKSIARNEHKERDHESVG